MKGSEVYPCFRSLFHGDHLGVEFALSSHATLLEEADLLRPRTRILGGNPFPFGPVYEGLVIDDYFALAVSQAGLGQKATSPAVACFEAARRKYDAAGVLGSPEKDIAGSRHFKVAGTAEAALSRGIVPVSAPVQKRLSLSVLATRLAGNWTSVLLYRRCLTCVLSRIYANGNSSGGDSSDVFQLDRKTADELVLAAIFADVAASDVSSPFHAKLYATGASIKKVAIVARDVTPEVAKVLWLGGDKRGSHVCLDGPLQQAVKILNEDPQETSLRFVVVLLGHLRFWPYGFFQSCLLLSSLILRALICGT